MIVETDQPGFTCIDVENADENNRVVLHIHRFPNGTEIPRRIIVQSSAWEFNWGLDRDSLDCERHVG